MAHCHGVSFVDGEQVLMDRCILYVHKTLLCLQDESEGKQNCRIKRKVLTALVTYRVNLEGWNYG